MNLKPNFSRLLQNRHETATATDGAVLLELLRLARKGGSPTISRPNLLRIAACSGRDGISRTTLYASLARLERDGFLEHIPRLAITLLTPLHAHLEASSALAIDGEAVGVDSRVVSRILLNYDLYQMDSSELAALAGLSAAQIEAILTANDRTPFMSEEEMLRLYG